MALFYPFTHYFEDCAIMLPPKFQGQELNTSLDTRQILISLWDWLVQLRAFPCIPKSTVQSSCCPIKMAMSFGSSPLLDKPISEAMQLLCEEI